MKFVIHTLRTIILILEQQINLFKSAKLVQIEMNQLVMVKLGKTCLGKKIILADNVCENICWAMNDIRL